jgi:ABC-type sugar transport system ATPase subunit
MRLLAALDKPTNGRVLVDGKDVTGLDVRKRSVAMVYQQFINYPSLAVYENIASPLRTIATLPPAFCHRAPDSRCSPLLRRRRRYFCPIH